MSRQEVERIDDEGIAAWNQHDLDAFAQLFSEDAVVTDVGMPEPVRGRDGARMWASAWLAAFPDLNLKQTNRIVSDDGVAGEVEFTGTNTGPMMMGGKEIPPTNKTVIGHGAYFARVRDGKMVEFSAHPDIAGMMMQLGFMPQM